VITQTFSPAVIEHIGRGASEDAIQRERREVLAKVRPIAEKVVVQHWRGDVDDNPCSHAESLHCFDQFGNRPKKSDH
jgi:hypothetical protein